MSDRLRRTRQGGAATALERSGVHDARGQRESHDACISFKYCQDPIYFGQRGNLLTTAKSSSSRCILT